jgi:hypothetical protein
MCNIYFMEIQSGISAEGQLVWAEILVGVINLEPRTGGWYALGMFAGIPSPSPSAKAVAPKELREKAIQEFQSTLRSLVDRWIDSGKKGEGEQPWARTVRHGAPESVEATLLRFWRLHPPEVRFAGGTQTIFMSGPPRHTDWVHLAERPESEVLELARDYAISFFVPLIDSPSRYRIFKCAKCRSYFFKERMPKKGTVINGGSYCEREQCKSAASIKRVYAGRAGRVDRMVGWAADAVSTWKPERRFGSIADWVVKHVREKQPFGERTIQINWYTLHKKEIEAEVKRRSHAAR